MTIQTFSIDSESEADAYLKDLFGEPEYRNMSEVQLRCAKLISDEKIKNYFINKAARELCISATSWRFYSSDEDFKKDYLAWKDAIKIYDEYLNEGGKSFEEMIPILDDLDEKHKQFMSHKKAEYK